MKKRLAANITNEIEYTIPNKQIGKKNTRRDPYTDPKAMTTWRGKAEPHKQCQHSSLQCEVHNVPSQIMVEEIKVLILKFPKMNV